MNEKEIPKDFINNLKIDENKNKKGEHLKEKIKSNKTNKLSRKKTSPNLKTLNYYNYYNEEYLESVNLNNFPKNNSQIQEKKRYNKSTKNFNHNNNYINDNNYNSNYDEVFFENIINKEKIEDLKKELNNQKSVMMEKINKINMLENMNDNLKNQVNKLQQNFEFEKLNNKEAKKYYNIIKNNYTDMRNQYDLLNIKYITLSYENFNYRRDKDLYEKQIKSKNEMIENLLENNSNFNKNNINNRINKIKNETKSSKIIISDKIISNEKKNKNDNINNINNKEKKENKNKENDKKAIDYNKFEKLSFPELQSKRDELIKERKDTYNIYCKIPLKSTSKEQIIKRNMLEKKIEEINCDLMLVKLKLKNFKNNK